jgi:hypothetical protein
MIPTPKRVSTTPKTFFGGLGQKGLQRALREAKTTASAIDEDP